MRDRYNAYSFSCALLFCLYFANISWAFANCPADHIDEQVQIAYIHDGDTLKLEDGRKLRLLGLDTPELSRNHKAAEPLALEARDFLRQLIQETSSTIKLRHDTEAKDRYKRILSHAFLSDGRNISALLLESGLAATLILPPNLWAANCYSDAQKQARRQNIGIWKLPSHQVVPLSQLPNIKKSLYLLVSATVQNIKTHKQQSRITLANGPHKLSLLIRGDERYLFKNLLKKLKPEQQVQVQGWINKKDEFFYLHLRHPSNLQIITP